jgi:glutathione S-transferase
MLEKMEQMDNQLVDGRTWLCGEQFTLADIAPLRALICSPPCF